MNQISSTYTKEEKDLYGHILKLFASEDNYRDGLHEKTEEYLRESQEVSLEDIVKVCCLAWQVDRSQLIKKINHQDELEKYRTYSFLWACRFFSNRTEREIWDFFGSKMFVYHKVEISTYWRLKHNHRGWGTVYLMIFAKLTLQCPGRIESAIKKVMKFEALKEGEFWVKCTANFNTLIKTEAYDLHTGKKYVVNSMYIGPVGSLHYSLRNDPDCTYPAWLFEEVR